MFVSIEWKIERTNENFGDIYSGLIIVKNYSLSLRQISKCLTINFESDCEDSFLNIYFVIDFKYLSSKKKN